jgi:biopolymer transport protein ExbB
MDQRAISPVQFAKRASKRTAALVHEELKSGLTSLATIASIAPLIGFFGTIIGIFDAPQGVGTERTTAMANLAERVSNACVPMAMGLLIGFASQCGYRYLSGWLDLFDCEMENAALELERHLTVYQGRSE